MIGAWIQKTIPIRHLLVLENIGVQRWCSNCRKWVYCDGSECPGSIDGVDITQDLRVYFWKGEAKHSGAFYYTQQMILEGVVDKIAYCRELEAYLLKWLGNYRVSSNWWGSLIKKNS